MTSLIRFNVEVGNPCGGFRHVTCFFRDEAGTIWSRYCNVSRRVDLDEVYADAEREIRSVIEGRHSSLRVKRDGAFLP